MFNKTEIPKKAIGLCLVVFMILSLLPVGVLAAQVEGQDKTVVFSIDKNYYYIGGNEVKTDVSAYIKNGRTMVPVAFVAPALGTEPAQWLPNERTVKIKKDNKEIHIKIDSNELLVNGKKMLMDVTAEIKDVGNGGGRTMLPISFIAKALEVGYEWRDDTRSVHFYGYNKIYAKAGSFGPDLGTEAIEGNVVIKADGVKLRNMVVKGNLIVAEEVGKGTVTLENITVKGDTLIRGGGKDSIHIIGGNYSNITIQNVDGQVRVTATGVDNLPVVIAEGAEGDEIILEGNFGSVSVQAPNTVISTQGQTVIGQIEVAGQANGAVITLGSTTTVTKVVLESQTEIKGTGTIKEAEVKADGIKFEKPPEQQTIAPNVTTPPTTTTTPPVTGGSGGGGGSSDTTVNVSGISVNPTTMTLTAGGATGTITATITPSDATNKNVNWTSSDTNVAAVANGVVTPVAAGTATITAAAAADGSKTATCTVTVNAASAGDFTPGEGGTLPAFTPFAEEPGKIGGLYISENSEPLLFYFGGNPIIRHRVDMKFLPPSSFGASGYKLQYSDINGGNWLNYQVQNDLMQNIDLTTSSDGQDNFSLESPGGSYQYRLLVVGGPKDGYTSNVVEAELVDIDISCEYTGWGLDERMSLTGVMAPYIGRGLEASFTATRYLVDGQDEVYTNQNMTYQWYRVNPVTYEMNAISGATGLTYTTTQEDAGYKFIIRATGDGVNVGGYVQILAAGDNVIPNNAYISNATDTGFTLNLYKAVDGLAVGDLRLTDKNGATVTIDSVTPGANNAIFNIAASINSSLSPYRLENNSDFWRIVSEVHGGHMIMQGIEIALSDTTVNISEITSAAMEMRSGSIIMGYTFSGDAGVITYEQAISDTYALDLATSNVMLAKYDGTTYTQIGNTVYLSSLNLGNSNVIGESANVTFADLGTLLTTFGLDVSDPADIPTHVKVVVSSKTSIDGNDVANPWGPIDSGWTEIDNGIINPVSINADNSTASIESGNKTAGIEFPVSITLKDNSNANFPNGNYAVQILNGDTAVGGGAEINFTDGQASVNVILASAGSYSLLVKVNNVEVETISNVTVVSPPVLDSSATTMDGTKILLGFSKDMADPTGKQNQFTVMVNGVENPLTAAALKTGDDSTIELTLTTALVGSETITVAYTRGDVAAADGGLLCTFVPADVTNNASVDTVIDIAAIAGVTAPARAAVPVTTITETAQYTGTVSWSPADNPFGPSTVYTATITLTPKTGFTLTGVAANFFTVADATSVTNAASSGVITAVFPATLAAPDQTAPVLSATSASGTTHTGTTLNFTSDEEGTYYYLVYNAADSAPDAATIKAQGAAVAKGTAAALAAANTASVTGLAPETAYKAYVVVEDAAGNISEVATIAFTTTAAINVPTISDLETTKDEVTITFSENIASIDLPNSISFASGTYCFDVFTSNGATRLGHYGLIGQTSNSMTIAILGDWEELLKSESFYFLLYTGDYLNNPTIIAQSENFFTFQTWSGTNTNIDAFIINSDEVWVTVEDTNSKSLITGLIKGDFTLFDGAGNNVDFNFAIGSQVDPFLPDHEYQLTPISGGFTGAYRVRFAKTEYNPNNEMFMIP